MQGSGLYAMPSQITVKATVAAASYGEIDGGEDVLINP